MSARARDRTLTPVAAHETATESEGTAALRMNSDWRERERVRERESV